MIINFQHFCMHFTNIIRTIQIVNRIVKWKRKREKQTLFNIDKTFAALTREIRRLITDLTQRNNYPDHDCVWPEPEPTILIIVGATHTLIPLGVQHTLFIVLWPLKAPQVIRLFLLKVNIKLLVTCHPVCSRSAGDPETGSRRETQTPMMPEPEPDPSSSTTQASFEPER